MGPHHFTTLQGQCSLKAIRSGTRDSCTLCPEVWAGRLNGGGQGATGFLRPGLQDAPWGCCPVHFLSSWDTRLAVNEKDQLVTTHRFSFSTDVNECFYEELNTCSEKELCLNVDGSYQCVCHQEPPTSFPQKLNRTCEGEMARTHVGIFPGYTVHRPQRSSPVAKRAWLARGRRVLIQFCTVLWISLQATLACILGFNQHLLCATRCAKCW